MDLFEIKSIIKKSLERKLREYAKKRKEPIREFRHFKIEIEDAIERHGFSSLIEESCPEEFFYSVHNAWSNIENELRHVDKASEISTWNESVDFHVKEAILALSCDLKLEFDANEAAEKVVLKLKR